MKKIGTTAAARIAGCSSDTIRRACQSKDLDAVFKEGKRGLVWSINENALYDWIDGREREKQEQISSYSEAPELSTAEQQGSSAAQKEDCSTTATSAPHDSKSNAARAPHYSSNAADITQQDSSTISAEQQHSSSRQQSPQISYKEEIVQSALKIAEQQREDRLRAEEQVRTLYVENSRLQRQLIEISLSRKNEQLLLSENSESLFEKEALIKERDALIAEEARRREAAEIRSFEERAARLENEARVGDLEETLSQMRNELEAERQSKSTEPKPSFWQRLFS